MTFRTSLLCNIEPFSGTKCPWKKIQFNHFQLICFSSFPTSTKLHWLKEIVILQTSSLLQRSTPSCNFCKYLWFDLQKIKYFLSEINAYKLWFSIVLINFYEMLLFEKHTYIYILHTYKTLIVGFNQFINDCKNIPHSPKLQKSHSRCMLGFLFDWPLLSLWHISIFFVLKSEFCNHL